MKRINIDDSWGFVLGKPNIYDMFVPRDKKIVNLPHDFMIESDVKKDAKAGHLSGYYEGGVGTYSKILNFTEEDSNKLFYVEFDGVYSNSTVLLNGNKIVSQHYGYTPFHADITNFINFGEENILKVVVNNSAQPNGRWYTGSGIYRHVDMRVSEKLHIVPFGIFAYTKHIVNDNACVVVETTVHNKTDKIQNVWANVSILDGKTVVGNNKIKMYIPAFEKIVAKGNVVIENAKVWDIDSPNLYNVKVEIEDESHVFDEDSVQFGVRTISVDAVNGLVLNGRTVKLKGGCVHHDNGILGAKALRDAEYRKMELHKKNGYNAIRFTHNPMSRDLLDACDELGLLVINEAFDVWTMEKSEHDFSLYFENEWEKELESFLKRDRSRACVIMWSTGNEIPERGGLSNGYYWSYKIANKVRELDHTRILINSVCSFFNGLEDKLMKKFFLSLREEAKQTGGDFVNLDSEFGKSIWSDFTEAYLSTVDVCGYNYLSHQYEPTHEKFHNRVICGTESKPKEMVEYWNEVLEKSYVIGDFNWTSFDYLGEAGIGAQNYYEKSEYESMEKNHRSVPYPYRTALDSDFGLCGDERPQLALRRILWGSDETYIAVHNPENYDKVEVLGRWGWPDCENHWTYPKYENKPIKIDVYSKSNDVELIINGKSIGKKSAGKEQKYIASFDTIYESGVIEAVSYNNGEIVSKNILKTSGEMSGIKITSDKDILKADGQSLAFVNIEVVDKDGNLIPYANLKAKVCVVGAATIAALGTSNPITEENYTSCEFITYKGKVMAVVRTSYEIGKATLKVEIDGMSAEKVFDVI